MDLRKSALASMLIAAAVTAAPARAESTKQTLLDRVVAVVGDDIITLVELRQRERPFLAKLASLDTAKRFAAETEMRKELVAELIDERIFAAAALEKRITVTSAEIDAALDAVAAQNGQSREATLQLAQQEGLDEVACRASLSRQILAAKMMRVVVLPRLPNETRGAPEEVLQKALAAEMRAWLDEKKSGMFIEVRL